MRIEGGPRSRGIVKQMRPGIPLISVITVVFNGAAYLEQAIRSVLTQNNCLVEYIVIDGGSTDGTLEIIRKYEERIDFWMSEPDCGIYDAMNKGIALATGELIGLLNSDDWYEPGALQKVADAWLTLSGTAMLVGDAFIVQEEMGIRYRHVADRSLWRGLSFPHQALFVPREVYRRFGAYDLRYRLGSDFDFVLRCVMAGVALHHVENIVVSYRLTGRSNRSPLVTLNEIRAINRRYFGLFSLPHGKFLMLFAKSAILEGLQSLIRLFMGERMLGKARTWYMKNVLARHYEELSPNDDSSPRETK